ncbi:MAG: peptide ABC transporter substrate-binding protein [Cyanobacteria bacterium J06635_15]
MNSRYQLKSRLHRQPGRIAPALLGLSLLGLTLLGSCSSPTPVTEASTANTEAEAIQSDPEILQLLYSRIPITLNPHLATGIQDFEAARIVYEPLASYDESGALVPLLVAEIPSVDNGGVAEDGMSVTWKLRQDVTWADGEPFTAADVVFTHEFIANPEVGATTAQNYEAIETVEAIDDYTVKITFTQPNPAWQLPFTGQNGVILPQHIFADFNGANAREAAANLAPVGTGPYQVTSYEPGQVSYEPNPNFRGGPLAFRQVVLRGGIAPYAAARAVLKTDEADFAHNLQIEAAALEALEADSNGRLLITFGSYVERIMLNPTDPHQPTESGEKSSLENPHPFLSDRAVRVAINYAIDREGIAQDLYGDTARPTAQLLIAPEAYASDTIGYEYNLDRAAALLEEAGWTDTDGNGIRDKDGIEMEMVFQTSINPVRQKTQEIVQANLAALGIRVEIKRVRVDDFFSADPAQTESINHFYADMQEYNAGNDTPDPSTYMRWWTCDAIASQVNQWQEPNNARYCNEDYDALWQAAQSELDTDKRTALFRQMDELLAQDVAVIPLVNRAVTNGISSTLTGLTPTPWDTSTWDIANWRRVDTTAPSSESSSTPAAASTPGASTPQVSTPAITPETTESDSNESDHSPAVDSTPTDATE